MEQEQQAGTGPLERPVRPLVERLREAACAMDVNMDWPVNAENIGRGEKLADELRGEIARLHGAVCQAVALLNRADFGRSAEVVKVHDILREVLVSHADECEDCHAKAGTVCADFDCPGRRAQAA